MKLPHSAAVGAPSLPPEKQLLKRGKSATKNLKETSVFGEQSGTAKT